MAYRTVGDVIHQARVLLQDTDGGPDPSGPGTTYRYSDADLYQGLNAGLLEARRIRPELFRDRMSNVPQYDPGSAANGLAFEPMYVPALIYYIIGWAQLRDGEEITDARGVQFLLAFDKKLVSTP